LHQILKSSFCVYLFGFETLVFSGQGFSLLGQSVKKETVWECFFNETRQENNFSNYCNCLIFSLFKNAIFLSDNFPSWLSVSKIFEGRHSKIQTFLYLPPMKTHLSKLACFFSIFFLIGITFYYSRWENKFTAAPISWDVSGYYLYLPAFLIYKDPAGLKFLDDVIQKYRPSPYPDQKYRLENGNSMLKYSAGMAVMYLPFFLLAHGIALIGSAPADGFSLPYQMAISWGSLLVALLGFWICRKNLLRFFDEKVTAVVLILLLFGSNYLNYVSFDSAMPHNYLFTLYALLIYFTIKWHEKPNFKWSVAIGLCCGLAALARPTEAISILIPLLWGMDGFSAVKGRLLLWKQQLPKLLVAGFLMGLIGAIQLVYWKSYSGHWLEYSYQDQGFSWWKPHFADVLYSYRKGWLVYTPVMLFALLGFGFLAKKNPKLFWVSLVFFLINFWIVSAWDIWWYGGGFGQRALIQSYALLVFPLAAFVRFVFQKKGRLVLVLPLFIFCIWLNLFQTWQARGHGLDTTYMTKAYYWRIFGNTDVQPWDKFLMDTDEDFRGERKNVRQVYFNDFEAFRDSSASVEVAHSGTKAIFTSPQKEFSPSFEIPKTRPLKTQIGCGQAPGFTGRKKSGNPGGCLNS